MDYIIRTLQSHHWGHCEYPGYFLDQGNCKEISLENYECTFSAQVGIWWVLCPCPCSVFAVYQPSTPPLAPSVMEAWGAAMNVQDATQDIQLTIDRVGDLSTRMDDTELVHMEVDERLHVVERDAVELKMDVTMLVAERETNREQMERAGQRWEQIRDVVVDQQDMITDLHNLVDLLREQILALQHGAGNPIVIEDFGGTDSEDSDLDYDDNDVVMFYPAPEGLLVPIEDDEETAVTSVL